jgi:acetyltransferase-like isoleucine patch superfamily enzyme
MTFARRLPGPLRHRLGRWLRSSRAVAAELGAIGPESPEAAAFRSFGEGAALLWPQGVIYNERYIEIGEGTMVGPNTAVTAGMAPTQEMPTNPVVSVGARCIIGRGSHIVGHWSIRIGDDIMTGPYVYITDQNHTYEDPDQPIGRQWPVESAVEIGSGSWLGANVVILPGTTLGRNTVVAAGAVVSGTFPDHVVLAGVPAKVVRRHEAGRGWVRAAPED